MTSDEGGKLEPADQALNNMVRDADEYYAQLKKRHASETREQVAAVGISAWFAAFVALGIGAYVTIKGSAVTEYIAGAFLAAIVVGVAGGLLMYAIRRRRGFKFAQLGDLLGKMKQGKVSSEDGIRLIDMMHQATLVMRKQRLDAALSYGLGAFILVSVVALNAGFGALAGVIVYLYFRFEAMKEYEREDARYEDSKKDLLLSL